MFTLNAPRNSPIQRAVAGLVFGLFGVLEVLVAVQMSANFGWTAAIVLGSLGVMFTVWHWGQAAYFLIHAASRQRYAEDELADEPAPPETVSVRLCKHCRAHLESSFRYCPQCGTKVGSDVLRRREQ